MANEKDSKLSFGCGPTLKDISKAKSTFQNQVQLHSRSRLVRKYKAADMESLVMAVYRAHFMSLAIEDYVDLAVANYATVKGGQMLPLQLLGTEQTEDGVYTELARRSPVDHPTARARKLAAHNRWVKMEEDSAYQIALRRLQNGDHSEVEFDLEYVGCRQTAAGDPDSQVVKLVAKIRRTLCPSVDDIETNVASRRELELEMANE